MLTNNIHSQLLSVSMSTNNKTKATIPPLSAMHTAIKSSFFMQWERSETELQ